MSTKAEIQAGRGDAIARKIWQWVKNEQFLKVPWDLPDEDEIEKIKRDERMKVVEEIERMILHNS